MLDTYAPTATFQLAGRDLRSPLTCDDVISLVAHEKRVSIRLLTHRSRCRWQTARARHLAMYLAHVVLGCSLAEIGIAFGRDRTTVRIIYLTYQAPNGTVKP